MTNVPSRSAPWREKGDVCHGNTERSEPQEREQRPQPQRPEARERGCLPSEQRAQRATYSVTPRPEAVGGAERQEPEAQEVAAAQAAGLVLLLLLLLCRATHHQRVQAVQWWQGHRV